MDMMSVEEMKYYWLRLAENIASDKDLNYKVRYSTFIEAYTTYLFYRDAVEEYYEYARGVAEGYGLDYD